MPPNRTGARRANTRKAKSALRPLAEMGGVESPYYVPVPAGKRTAVRGPERKAPAGQELLARLNALVRRAA